MLIRSWSRWAGWTAVAVATVCALGLSVLVGFAALETGKGIWAATLFLTLGILAAGSALFVDDAAPWQGRHWSAWLQPRPLALVFVAIFIGFGVMTDAMTLLEPRPAVESESGAIEKGVKEIRKAVLPDPHNLPRIRTAIAGVWGESNCEVTYRFVAQERALTVEALRRPSGSGPFRLIATITAEHGDVMSVTGEKPPAARGKAATFTYFNNGVIERLTWDDQVRSVPLELDRCA